MKPVSIGRGMYRITLRSKQKREKLAAIPDVQVEETRVIFPAWLMPHVERIVEPETRKKTKPSDQTSLFD